MSKKWKVILSAVAAVVVLSLGVGAVAMANGEQPVTASNPLLARVAEILGITEQQLTDALKQANQQVASETLDKWLGQAMEKGVITQSEADAIKAWLAVRPDLKGKEAMKAWLEARPQIAQPAFIKWLLQAPARIKQYACFMGRPGLVYVPTIKKAAVILGIEEQKLIAAFQQATAEMQQATFEKALDNAVTNGKLTQDEANEIKSWWAQRPAALQKLMPNAGLNPRGWGSGCGKMRGFGGWGNAAPRVQQQSLQ